MQPREKVWVETDDAYVFHIGKCCMAVNRPLRVLLHPDPPAFTENTTAYMGAGSSDLDHFVRQVLTYNVAISVYQGSIHVLSLRAFSIVWPKDPVALP